MGGAGKGDLLPLGSHCRLGGAPGDTPGRGGCSRLQDQIWLLSGSGHHSVPPSPSCPRGRHEGDSPSPAQDLSLLFKPIMYNGPEKK